MKALIALFAILFVLLLGCTDNTLTDAETEQIPVEFTVDLSLVEREGELPYTLEVTITGEGVEPIEFEARMESSRRSFNTNLPATISDWTFTMVIRDSRGTILIRETTTRKLEPGTSVTITIPHTVPVTLKIANLQIVSGAWNVVRIEVVGSGMQKMEIRDTRGNEKNEFHLNVPAGPARRFTVLIQSSDNAYIATATESLSGHDPVILSLHLSVARE